jgi:hypothetical protein
LFVLGLLLAALLAILDMKFFIVDRTHDLWRDFVERMRFKHRPNIEDHSQIVRFVSSFISDEFAGIVRAGASRGVVLPSFVGVRQQKCGFAPT